MKTISKLIFILSAASFAFASCQQENLEPYSPGEDEVAGCYGVYFPAQEATGPHTYDPTMPTETYITVARKNSTGAITVPVEVKDAKGVYSVEPLTFADGQAETELHITFNNAEIGVVYPMSVIITDPQYASKYSEGATSFDFSAFRVEWKYFLNPQTNEPAVFSYSEGWNGHSGTAKVKYYEVDGVRTCVTETEPYEEDGETYYGFWASGEEYEFTFKWYLDSSTPGIDGEMYQGVQVPAQACDFHPTYGADVEVFDYYQFYTDLNPQPEFEGISFPEFAKKYGSSYPCCYYDGNGGFYFYWVYYYMRGIGGWGVDEYDTIMLADGFIRTDYSIAVETGYSDDQGSLPAYFTTGVDAAEIKYVAVEGEISAAQASKLVDAIASGSAKDVQSITEFEYDDVNEVNLSAAALSFEETGDYSLVAVTFDEAGNAKENTYVSFFYVSGTDPEYDFTLNTGLEPTPERYFESGYDRTNSLEYYVSGSDLTDVKYLLFGTDEYEKIGHEAAVEAVRKSDSVSDAELMLINMPGGYASLYTGLKANTDYTIVVLANNGAKSGVVTANLMTEGLPNEVLGMGDYTYDCVFTGTDTDLSFEFNPNTGLYEIKDWCFGVNLTFDVDEDGLIQFEPQYIGYDYQGVAPVYILEASDILYEEEMEEYGLEPDDHSYYDEKTDTYYFCAAYYVPSLGGGFGAAWEDFQITSREAGTATASSKAALAPASSVKIKAGNFKKVSVPEIKTAKPAGFSVERTPSTVSFSARAIAPKSMERKSVKNLAPSKAAKTGIVF